MSIRKGDDIIAGVSVGFIRKPAWSQAVAISAADLTAGYAIPADGMIVGAIDTSTSIAGTGVYSLTVNNVVLARISVAGSGMYDDADIACAVNKNDVVQLSGASFPITSYISFVPFEDSAVSDVEVVTPEYIRNQNILSDWEGITISTSSSSPTVMPYDGFIYSATFYAVDLYINTEKFPISDHVDAPGGDACMVAVRKGDKVYIGRDSGDKDAIERVAYYKLRDYTGR